MCYLQIYSYQFLQFIYSETKCCLSNFMLDVIRFASTEEGAEVWGRGGWAEGRKEIKSVPRATSWGVVKGTKRPTGGSVSPFCPAVTSCPGLEVGKSVDSGPEEGPGMATVRRSQLGDLGAKVPFHRWGPGHPRKAFPSSFRVKDWPKEVFGMGLQWVW